MWEIQNWSIIINTILKVAAIMSSLQNNAFEGEVYFNLGELLREVSRQCFYIKNREKVTISANLFL